MTAYQCDRCGRYYTFKDYADYVFKNNKGYKIVLERIPDSASIEINLCNQCTEALDKWLFPNKGLVNVDETWRMGR